MEESEKFEGDVTALKGEVVCQAKLKTFKFS
jgi:hypothetical protein